MNPPDPSLQAAMPESLRRQLEDFRRELWRIKVMEAVAAGLIGLLVSFLLVYGLDRFVPTPGWLRLVLLLAGCSLFAVFAPYWIHRWVWQRRRHNQLARLIARRYPGLGDRLLGVIELQSQQEAQDTLSPRLREAAFIAVAAEAGKRPLQEALPSPRHRLWSLAALALLAGAGAALMLTPRAGVNALQRWLMPLSDTQRYTFTRLQDAPSQLIVAKGEAFDLRLSLAADSDQTPQRATARIGLQAPLTSTLENRGYAFKFPGQQDRGVITLRIGDLVHELQLEPRERPKVLGIWAKLTPPAYLGLSTRSTSLQTGGLSAVQGSTLSIEMDASEPLASAHMSPVAGETTQAPATRKALKIDGHHASTGPIPIGPDDLEIPFDWVDTHGLQGGYGFKLRIDSVEDAAPTSYTQGLNRQHLMLPEETIEFELLAEDDFGVLACGIEWQGEYLRATGKEPAKGEVELAQGQADENRLLKPVAFSPAAYGIEPQKILLRGWTTDRFPGRGRVYSEPVVIYVLTRTEHAQILKQRFDRAITELEDLARRELNLLDENQQLEKLTDDKLQNDENRKRIDEQRREETETKNRTSELTEQMEQLLKDAVRNGDIDKEAMRKMAEALKSMQELSKEDVPGVEQKLEQAGDPSNTPQKSKSEMSKAVQQQQQVVEKMRKTIEKANQANEGFEASTFVKRLEKAAGEERAITSAFKESFTRKPRAQLLGVTTDELSATDRLLLDDKARQQSQTTSDVRWIQEDLMHFHARTQKPIHKQVVDEMTKADIATRMESIREKLDPARILTYTAAEKAMQNAELLEAWAKLLKGDEGQGNDGGSGNGDGGGNKDKEDFEFMLRVMKMIQTEQDLRARTRALEQLRRSAQPQSSIQP